MRPPEIICNMPMPEYICTEAVNTGLVTAALRSPAHYIEAKREPYELKQDDLGSALHCAVLEPDRFAAEYVCVPEDIGSLVRKKGRDWLEDAKKRTARELILPYAAYQKVYGMRDAVMADPEARELIEGAVHEESHFWDDPKTGLRCKARVDSRLTNRPMLCDIKTTDDARLNAASRRIAQQRWHIQPAHYLRGASITTGTTYSEWRWIFVELERPHGVCVHHPSPDLFMVAEYEIDTALELIAHCRAEGVWPAYNDRGGEVTLPPWME
jgi:hypothetical protein